jgi:Domain of unknown function (DUF4419)
MVKIENSGVTFDVDDVALATSPLNTCKPLEAVRALLEAPPGSFAADESLQGNPTRGRLEACWSYALDCVAGIGHHPLVAAAHLAFSGHRPLIMSPDLIWVTIVQGLAQHVRLSPETHRAFLVRHEGKRELTVKRDDLQRGSPENPWTEVVADFALQLRREIGELAGHFVCDFSTTGPVERTVSEVSLLDVLQPYFSYNVVCICGIPSVTLEGTPADWRKLRRKVDLLAPFGLDWWLSELRPICDQFARAAAGDIDRKHWRRLYKVRAVYGAEVINGWLGKLFPYTKDMETGKFSRRNDLLDPKVEAEIRKLEAEERRNDGQEPTRFHAPGITAEALPRGLSQVPFTLSDLMAGTKRAMEMVAGPIVVTQHVETGALRPTLGWAVRESAPIEQAMIRLAEHTLEPVQVGLSWEALRALGVGYLPTDVLRFYHEAAGASIHGKNRVPLYRVLPLAEWTEPEWAQKWTTRFNGEKMKEPSSLLRFAESSDGTELVIQLYCTKRMHTGAVFVGRRRDGQPVAETGQKVARSFTDFLLRALDGGSDPYFRRAGFVPLV